MGTSRSEHEHIHALIEGANEHVVVVSPFLGDPLLERSLATAVAAGASVRIVTRPGQEKQLGRAADWCEIGHLRYLHAKLYLSESTAIITSANVTGRGPQRSLESSRVFNRASDEAGYMDVWEDWQQVEDEILRDSSPDDPEEAEKASMEVIFTGRLVEWFCWRCATPVEREGELCKECDAREVMDGFRYTRTRFCQGCGQSRDSNLNYPWCDACYGKVMRPSTSRWRAFSDGETIGAETPLDWVSAPRDYGISHPIKKVGKAMERRLWRVREAKALHGTLRSDREGVDLLGTWFRVWGLSLLGSWPRVQQCVLERSKRPASDPESEDRVRLELRRADPESAPSAWKPKEALASWELAFKSEPDSIGGLELAAKAARRPRPDVLPAREPLGLYVAVLGPPDTGFDVVRWTASMVPWFVAAAHRVEIGDAPPDVDSEVWNQLRAQLGQPGPLGQARLSVDGGRLKLEGVRNADIGLFHAQFVERDVKGFAMKAWLAKLEHIKKKRNVLN